MANALWHAGLRPHGRVGVYGGNCPEWTITQQAANRLSGRIGTACDRHTPLHTTTPLTTVPLYDTLGATAVQYIMLHANVSVVVVAGDKFKQLVPVLPAVKQQVTLVVYWGSVDSALLLEAEKTGVPVQAFDAFVKGGTKAVDPVPPSPTDPACIMYTRCVHWCCRSCRLMALDNASPVARPATPRA